jgi:hypothetical protein
MEQIFIFTLSFIVTILFVVHNEHGKPETVRNVALSISTIIVFEVVKLILDVFI